MIYIVASKDKYFFTLTVWVFNPSSHIIYSIIRTLYILSSSLGGVISIILHVILSHKPHMLLRSSAQALWPVRFFNWGRSLQGQPTFDLSCNKV